MFIEFKARGTHGGTKLRLNLLKRKICFWIAFKTEAVVFRLFKSSIVSSEYPVGTVILAGNPIGGRRDMIEKTLKFVQKAKRSDNALGDCVVGDDDDFANGENVFFSFHFHIPNAPLQTASGTRASLQAVVGHSDV
jgi:hypothetical protein